jgi:Pyridoxamine 5'-phosphate oxidase
MPIRWSADGGRSGMNRPYVGCEHLEILDPAECRLLLEERGVGRIGGALHGHPVIFPVNYVVLDDAIVCRARRGGDLERATCNVLVAFEIDRADNIYHEGWSVLAVGRSSHMTDPSELAQFQGLHLLPWAGEERDLFVRISLDEVSGRRIHHREA